MVRVQELEAVVNQREVVLGEFRLVLLDPSCLRPRVAEERVDVIVVSNVRRQLRSVPVCRHVIGIKL